MFHWVVQLRKGLQIGMNESLGYTDIERFGDENVGYLHSQLKQFTFFGFHLHEFTQSSTKHSKGTMDDIMKEYVFSLEFINCRSSAISLNFKDLGSFSFLSYSNKYMFYCGLGGSIYSGKLCPRWAYGGHLTGISKCGYWQPCKPLSLQQWHDPHHHAEHHSLFYDTCSASCTLACDPWIRVMQTFFS